METESGGEMTDKELLELAAKAAGIDLKMTTEKYKDGSVCYAWNPLTNDGDALRLAVTLNLSMDLFEDVILVGLVANNNDAEQLSEDTFPDPYAATRRAIVRAAAEIGKSTTLKAAR